MLGRAWVQFFLRVGVGLGYSFFRARVGEGVGLGYKKFFKALQKSTFPFMHFFTVDP